MKTKSLLFSAFIVLSTFSMAQTTIYVPQDYEQIQQAIDAASDGDIVLVDTGIYYENIRFKGKAIIVKSYFDPLEPDSTFINYTIIDGSQPSNPNLGSVVYFNSGEDTTSVLSGFTIQHGTGTLSSWPSRQGGGICCFYSGPKIIHNLIIDNHLNHDYIVFGGGIGAYALDTSHHLILKHNTIKNNSSVSTSDYPGSGNGGGVVLWGLNCTVENNRILSNTIDGRPYGAGITVGNGKAIVRYNEISHNTGNSIIGRSKGAGLYLEDCYENTVVEDNEITYNNINNISGSSNGGGGIGILNLGNYYNDILLERNIITNNSAMKGGGIFVQKAYKVTLANNVVQNNEAYDKGGGIHFTPDGKDENYGFTNSMILNNKASSLVDGVPVLVNNTITGNTASSSGGGIFTNMTSDYVLFNNIIFDNSAGTVGNEIYLSTICNAFLNNNNIDTNEISGNGTWQGDGNIDVQPCFDEDGFHLLQQSGCINEGINFVDFNGTIYYAPGTDIDQELRPYNGAIEIGADEVLITDVTETASQVNHFSIFNYPNPFTSKTLIEYQLQHSSIVQLSIYNQLGEKVMDLVNKQQTQGKHHIVFNGNDLPAGVYFCTLKSEDGVETVKIVKY